MNKCRTIFKYRLSSAMEAQNKTRSELTKHLGAGPWAVQKYFYGNLPSVERLCEIADYLGVSTDYLLGRTNRTEVVK